LKIALKIKKHFVKFFVADALFFTLLGALFLYLREKITKYILMLNGYAQQVSQLSELAQTQQEMVVEQMQVLAASIEPLTMKVKFLVYFVFPVALYLIWSLTQVVYYNVLQNKKFYDLKGVGKFLIINLPFFAFLLLLIELIFRQITIDSAINVNLFIIFFLIIALVLAIYVMEIAYSIMHRYDYKKLFGRTWKLVLTKSHKFFPLFLLCCLIFFICFIFLWDILIKLVSIEKNYWLSGILLIISIAGWVLYKTFVIDYYNRNDKK
jgi:hypothetical protein